MNTLLATAYLAGCSHHRAPDLGPEAWTVPLARVELGPDTSIERPVMWELHVNDTWVTDFLGQTAVDQCREHLKTETLCFVHPWPCARVQIQRNASYLFMWTGHCIEPDPRTWYLGMAGSVRTFQVPESTIPMLWQDRPELRVFALPEPSASSP